MTQSNDYRENMTPASNQGRKTDMNQRNSIKLQSNQNGLRIYKAKRNQTEVHS